ncbi:PEP/pyruvate-binding domain-containing protein [Desulfovibrio subterraneus]|uniref:Phosphoenolpyruvate synthase n=1 Tax=Desulfovibrio subterraneus TaxID=2718620 RepID=A0A7J0BMG0_9BACT|nr:PEP/pyruvate-binding domain-containing protein [Desulfovibrio subterraneus]GFM34866.1 pyruvate, phosphate dikinase [Desulfovibrio subterraneus]
MISPFKAVQAFFAARKHRHEERALTALKARYHAFRIFLENNGQALELIVAADNALHHGEQETLQHTTDRLISVTGELVDGLNLLSGEAHTGLYTLHGKMGTTVRERMQALITRKAVPQYCITFDALDPSLHPLAGTKAANLAQLHRMRLPVPDGFVCTTRCCRDFLASGDMAANIRTLLREVERGELDVPSAASLIGDVVKKSPLPHALKQAMHTAFDELAQLSHAAAPHAGFAVSVRSSGVAEDRPDHSFAGQFTSVLNVTSADALCDAYKEVIASGFSARAIAYRLNAGLSPADFDLAVLCQRMVAARCAGVLMTRNPAQPETGRLLISAAPGLGTLAVGGSAPVDLYHPWRSDSEEPAAISLLSGEERQTALLMDKAEIAHKTIREVSLPDGGVAVESVPPEEADAPLLTPATLQRLVMFGEMIENIEGTAQDVEWAVSHDGEVHILQARPLRLTSRSGILLPAPVVGPPLATGICASAGKTAGRVRIARNAAELQMLEAETNGYPRILVLPQALVDAARHLQRYAGVIIDSGNPTDHLSCIAREYGIPLVTAVRNGCTVLQPDQWIVLDADNGLVHAAPEHLWMEFSRSGQTTPQPDTPEAGPPESAGTPTRSGSTDMPGERHALWEMLVPLNLTEAYGGTFSWQECRSMHDLVRYTHEMAVLAMFDAGDTVMEEAGGLLRPLDLGIPFHFLVIDLGGATRRQKQAGGASLLRRAIRNPLQRDDVLSAPLAALCEGLLTPGLSWHADPDPEAISGIMSRTMLDARSARPAGSFNYALAARDYLNLNARVEFHFAMLDAVCGGDAQANYIRFRFKGGGAGPERGHRRAMFLRHVLEGNGFVTTVVGDLITASLTGASRDVVRERMIMLGRLLGYSRFLDGTMKNDDTPLLLAEHFLQGHYDSRLALENDTDSEPDDTVGKTAGNDADNSAANGADSGTENGVA